MKPFFSRNIDNRGRLVRGIVALVLLVGAGFGFTVSVWLGLGWLAAAVFFGFEARNLQTLTPPWLKFEVLTPSPIILRPGTLIDYRITVHGLPIRWPTEIAEWDPPHRFVDVQLSGPYTLWHHTHTFEEQDGGTLCLDRVRYRPRGGALVHWLYVRRDVERIFQYRQQGLMELFGCAANKSVVAGTLAP